MMTSLETSIASTNLLTALTSLSPGQDSCRVVFLPAAAPAPAGAAPARRRFPVRALLRPVMSLVRLGGRLVLRQPRVRQVVLGTLARFPALHARAYRILFSPDMSIDLDPVPLDPALAQQLSPRARLIARRLMLDVGARGSINPSARPRLAFVSPLPPERTGIADYAVQLLPALCRHFDIELIVEQETLVLPPELAALPVRNGAWLAQHADTYDKILYQIGNSEFHSYMFDLLRDHPGVVVLHDFFLGNVMAYRQVAKEPPGAWTGALFHSHGYPALRIYQQAGSRPGLLKSHPCNLAVLQAATRVIVHSDHAAELARVWYGEQASANWTIVPLPRAAPSVHDRAAARQALGIAPDVFLVCSFGYIGQNKLTDRLLAAWMEADLHRTPNCLLVLVGANHNSPFGARVAEQVRSAGGSVRIAGWTDETVFRAYLQAADVGVQLRTSAQGETSAAVLDCMNYGLPTIVNANGSMAALPEDAVWRLPDNFENAALAGALQSLRMDDARRRLLGQRAAALLEAQYRPHHCAVLYRDAIARAAGHPPPLPAGGVAVAAAAMARQDNTLRQRQLLVDIGTPETPLPPAAAAQLDVLLEGVAGFRVEPVFQSDDGALRYARTATAARMGFNWRTPDDPLADLAAGDVFYQPAPAAGADALHGALRSRGVLLALAVTDENAPDDAFARTASRADLLICNDAATAGVLTAQLAAYNYAR